MDIKLIPEGRMDETFVFPSLPEEVRGAMSTEYRSYPIISKGTVMVPAGMKPAEYSWDGEFFGPSKRNERIVKKNYWQEPNACVDQLRKWMDEGTILNLIITDTWVNSDVTISQFTPTAYGGFGNVRYSIAFQQYRNLQIYTTADLNIGNGEKPKTIIGNRTPKPAFSGHTYLIEEGDTLWSISVYVYGTGTKWINIWKKNKKTLDKAAKYFGYKNSNNGKLLFAGTKITIP